MKMKRAILIGTISVVVIAMVIATVGCGSKDKEAEPETTATTTTTTEATTAAPKDTEILKAKLNEMIGEFGKGSSDGSGVTNAKVLDMDGDGTKEMVVIHDMKANIIAVKNGKAESIFEGTIGIQYGQTDTSYEALINESIKPTALVLFNSSDEWSDENITVVTISEGAAAEKSLKASTTGENDTPAREELVSFSIDGNNVSASEYENEYNRITEGADSINPMSPADLDEIMASM